jgi:putative ABC transport system ATP-binding protein
MASGCVRLYFTEKGENEMAKTAVEFKDVVKTYGKGDGMQTAVDHVSFTIDEGEFVVILGQSGAGKSTVLNMLGGMDVPTEGKVIVAGQEISSFSDKKLSAYRADTIGFIFQFYNLIPGLTAYENVTLVKDIKKNALDANEMLDRVGLADQKHKFPSQMSGGQQQRVSIARALAKDPKIILGDEPTGALDSETGKLVIDMLQKLSTESGNTVILVTHNADIAKCANKIIHMRNGKIKSIKTNDKPLSADEIEW